MALLNFDANEIDPNSFEPMPAGEYPVVISKSEMMRTKNGAGRYLFLGMYVIDGEFKGRVLYDRLNIDNPNEQAVRIAQAALSSICRAVGVMTPRDSSELHDKPLLAVVAIQPANENFGASNRVRGYKPMHGAALQAPLTSAAPKKAPAAMNDAPGQVEAAAPKKPAGKKPWE